MSDFDFFERCKHENFSTALLAFSMRRSPEFCNAMIRKFAPSQWGQIEQLEIETIKPQYTIEIADSEKKRPDMVITGKLDGKGFLIALEVKIAQDFAANQLKNYRTWLSKQQQPLKGLAILTRRRYEWSYGDVAKPDVALRWIELCPIVATLESSCSGFEASFWQEFRLHLEAIMRTFEGFSGGSFNVHGFMQEVDLFLRRLLEDELRVKCKGRWGDNFSGYNVPELGAKVGFYWWQGDFWDERQSNQLCVERRGENGPIPLASLEEVVTESNDPERRNDYIKRLAQQIRDACKVEADSRSRRATR